MESRRYLTTHKMQQLASGKLPEDMIELYLLTFAVCVTCRCCVFSDVVAGCELRICPTCLRVIYVPPTPLLLRNSG
jgi:hypothetical protein